MKTVLIIAVVFLVSYSQAKLCIKQNATVLVRIPLIIVES